MLVVVIVFLFVVAACCFLWFGYRISCCYYYSLPYFYTSVFPSHICLVCVTWTKGLLETIFLVSKGRGKTTCTTLPRPTCEKCELGPACGITIDMLLLKKCEYFLFKSLSILCLDMPAHVLIWFFFIGQTRGILLFSCLGGGEIWSGTSAYFYSMLKTSSWPKSTPKASLRGEGYPCNIKRPPIS